MNEQSQTIVQDDAISVTFSYDRALWRRGMTGWWQSVVPTEPFIKRAIFWAFIWLMIFIVALAVSAFGLSIWYVGTGLIGAGIMISVFAYLQRTRMSRFWDEIGRHWDKAGETHVTFDEEGLMVDDDVSSRALKWQAVDAIKPVRGATVIRSAITMLVIPDAALPNDLTPKEFRQTISGWRGI
ncbi:MAG: hypothetical protein OXQ92_15990 [Boseongicola sp.]|nr:hypothetical protein [Boseongicola sp.]MDD9976534.1 hypothetical protein [Boseongicola sp.]